MPTIVRDNLARETLHHIKKWLDGYYQDDPPKALPIKGFFREGPYLWTAFKFEYIKYKSKKKANEWELTITKNIQHEGYCKERLKIGPDDTIKH